MTFLLFICVVLLSIIVYGSFFLKELVEEIEVKEQVIFNLKKALQEEQDKVMFLNRSVQLLNDSKRPKIADVNYTSR